MRRIVLTGIFLSVSAIAEPPAFTWSGQDPLGLLPKDGVEFGFLEVAENRSRKDGRSIRLPVYRFKSASGPSDRSPILFTMGGPGSSSLDAAPYANYYGLNSDRDFLIFEQRGTKHSVPALECPKLDTLLTTGWGLPNTGKRAERMNALRACRASLAKLAELEAYHTEAIARDLEDLRDALGYESLSLLTLSYSTRLAQVLMHDYPDRVDQVVMAGAFPVDLDYEATAHRNQRDAVQRLLRACAEEHECSRAFPELEARFFARVAEFNVTPVVRTGQSPVTGGSLLNLVPIASTGALPGIPASIFPLLDAPRSYFAQQSTGSESSGFALGMRLSVWCAEEGSVRSSASNSLSESPSNPIFPKEACTAWNVPARNVSRFLPAGSDIPVLLFAGAYDPLTPAIWSQSLANRLTNAQVIVWPTMSHQTLTNWDTPCPLAVVQSFFRSGFAGMEYGCANNLRGIEFDLGK